MDDWIIKFDDTRPRHYTIWDKMNKKKAVELDKQRKTRDIFQCVRITCKECESIYSCYRDMQKYLKRKG